MPFSMPPVYHNLWDLSSFFDGIAGEFLRRAIYYRCRLREAGEGMAKRKDQLAEQMGKRIKAAMAALGLTQPQTARLLGISPDTFGSAVRGWHRVQLDVLIKLPSVLHRSVEYFLGLPEPSDLSSDEQELLSYYRSYHTEQMKAALRDDARRHLEVERALLPIRDGQVSF